METEHRLLSPSRTRQAQEFAIPAHDGGSTMPVQAQDAMHETDDAMAMGQDTPWAHSTAAVILGVWLITSPFALDYRSATLTWSDVISGSLIIALAVVTLARGSVWAPWASSLVGVWLLFAPLVFKAPTAAAFTNDTLAGTLVIAFVILMPGMPGGMRMLPGPDAPPGWSYNPSSWAQRAPIIALALLGFFLSRQMAAYQLGYTQTVWEPFFDPGTRAVLGSEVSRNFPISDAGLGGVAYMVEALMGFMGDKFRWRTMPWMVTFFGILVVPLGIVSITLIILQPLAVGAWCTPCLIAGLAMLIMIALTLDEVVAMGVFLVRAHREGQALGRVFWMGGTLAGTGANGAKAEPVREDIVAAKAMVWGVALPWNLIASAALGIWLMASPTVFGTSGTAAHTDHLIGALIVSFSIMSLADVGRALRFINIPLAIWVIAAPWLVGTTTTGLTWNDAIAGVLVILLSLPRGPIRERYGTWSASIR